LTKNKTFLFLFLLQLQRGKTAYDHGRNAALAVAFGCSVWALTDNQSEFMVLQR